MYNVFKDCQYYKFKNYYIFFFLIRKLCQLYEKIKGYKNIFSVIILQIKIKYLEY